MLPRFFVASGDIEQGEGGAHVTLTGEKAHHAMRVLRLRPGDALWVCDGTGVEYPGRIVGFHGDTVEVSLGEPQPAAGEPAHRITLFQGLPKGDKMDWVVQKAAEVGIDSVVPLHTERSVVRLTEAKARSRAERWHRIAEAAASQAARGRVPAVLPPADLAGALEAWRTRAPEGILIVPWEEARSGGLRAVLRNRDVPLPREVGILIGPEGGLTEEEVEQAKAQGGIVCTLGPRILRTETAGAVVAALVLYEAGEMGG